MWRPQLADTSVRARLDRDFLTQVGTTFLVQAATVGLSLSTGVLLARYLGAEGKGVVALALLIPSVLALVVGCGLGPAATYFIGSRRGSLELVSGTVVVLGFLAGAAGLGLGALLTWTGLVPSLLPGVPTWLLLLGMVAVPLIVLGDLQGGMLQGLGRIVTLNLVRLGQATWVLIATGLLLGVANAGPTGAVVAILLGAGAYWVSTGALVQREGGRLAPHWDTAIARRMLGFGLRGHVGTIAQFMNYRLDVFLVNYFLGAAQVGLYTVAFALAETLWYLPNAVGFVIFPKAASTAVAKMNSFTPQVLKAVLILSVMAAAVLAITGRSLIATLFSPAFLPAYEPMLLLLPGVVLLGGGKVLTNELAGRGYPHYNSVLAGAALVITVIGDVLLIPRYGLAGAALTSSVAYGTIFVGALMLRRVVVRTYRM